MTPMSDDSATLLASFSRRLAERRPTRSAESQAEGGYHRAAAVLHVFDPSDISPFESPVADPRPSLTALVDDSVPAVGFWAERLRTLNPDVRRDTLGELGSLERMRAALRANPKRLRTPLQLLFESWLSGTPIVLDALTYAQLSELQHLYEWGLDRFGPLPDPRAAESARLRRGAVAVFEHLVDDHFIGRSKELQRLRDHVGVVSPSHWVKLRSFLPGDKPALVVFAPGGTGKTALIGRFLFEHVTAAQSGWFPFAYLPFDSDTVDVGEPYTLLVAAAGQLASQVASASGPTSATTSLERIVDTFRADVGRYRDARGVLQQRANALTSQGQRLSGLSEAERKLYEAFCALLRGIAREAGEQQGASDVPVLLVLDTFEEVLYRTREVLSGLWQMLTIVRQGFPGLRIVIASRAKPRDFEIDRKSPSVLELGPLEEDDAVQLLMGLGVDDNTVARAIAKQVGGQPLSLRLAARVASEETMGKDGIAGLTTKRYWFVGLAAELIQGQLYVRILDHIHDPDVRVLAHPGLVLRRVTADLIEKVLAPVCGLQNVDANRARELFALLAAEHALVSAEVDGALKYREDIRHPMLLLLARDKPDDVRRLHEATVAYYESRSPTETVERAEEIYHRLMLGQSRTEVLSRWIDGVERYLTDAIPEIPVEQSVWLAERMNLELPKDVYKKAELSDWERLFGRKALEALRHSGPQSVLALLGERKERTPESPLFAMEARCLIVVGRRKEALELIDRALSGYPPYGNAGRLAELLWIKTDVMLSTDATDATNATDAAVPLRQLVDMSRSLPSPLTHVQALAALVELEDTLSAPTRAATRELLASALQGLKSADIDADRSVVRLAAIRLGPAFPTTLKMLLPYLYTSWLTLVELQNVDVRPQLERAAPMLRTAGRDDLAALATAAQSGDVRNARSVASQIIEQALSSPMDNTVAAIVLQLLDADHATLRGASLAGLDSFREPWELASAPELRA